MIGYNNSSIGIIACLPKRLTPRRDHVPMVAPSEFVEGQSITKPTMFNGQHYLSL